MRQCNKKDLIQQLLPFIRGEYGVKSVYFRVMSKVQLEEVESPVTEAGLAASSVLVPRLKRYLYECVLVSEYDFYLKHPHQLAY